MNTLMSDWLCALGVAKELNLNVSRHCTHTKLAYTYEGERAYYCKLSESVQDGRIARIHVHPEIAAGTHIERVEVLLSAFSHVELWFQGRGHGESLCGNEELAKRLGCWHGNVLTLRERWRLLAISQPLATLRIAHFEDRECCAVCHRHMATGSSVPTKNGTLVHDHCFEFVNLVMIPALKLQQAEQEAKPSA